MFPYSFTFTNIFSLGRPRRLRTAFDDARVGLVRNHQVYVVQAEPRLIEYLHPDGPGCM